MTDVQKSQKKAPTHPLSNSTLYVRYRWSACTWSIICSHFM